tara:strand:- start:305 stop:454 length:150 start_codon:yes stop_codon:yes gene_type:complete
MIQNIDNNEKLIEILLNSDNQDLAEKVLKELGERGENTGLLEKLLRSDS